MHFHLASPPPLMPESMHASDLAHANALCVPHVFARPAKLCMLVLLCTHVCVFHSTSERARTCACDRPCMHAGPGIRMTRTRRGEHKTHYYYYVQRTLCACVCWYIRCVLSAHVASSRRALYDRSSSSSSSRSGAHTHTVTGLGLGARGTSEHTRGQNGNDRGGR